MKRLEKVDFLLDEVSKELSKETDFPSLYAQIRQWSETRPLSGLEILDATPVFLNTVAKHAALVAGGANLSVISRESCQYDPRIPDILTKAEIPFYNHRPEGKSFDFILDCAAANSDIPARKGRCELTRSGIQQYKKIETNVPIFATDSGRIKSIETTLGTGDGCYRAMLSDGLSPAGKHILLFGHGRVGHGIESILTHAGAIVHICDPKEGKFFHPDMLHGTWAVITATGFKHALNDIAGHLYQSEALLINMGADDEFGPAMPSERVLHGKQTFNFSLREPTRTCYIDSTLALDNAGVLHLLRHPGLSGFVIPPPELENAVLEPALQAGVINEQIKMLNI